jgi:hypothetical protein
MFGRTQKKAENLWFSAFYLIGLRVLPHILSHSKSCKLFSQHLKKDLALKFMSVTFLARTGTFYACISKYICNSNHTKV